ncbi:MAG: peptidylprolyl isomerase, partial [Nitrosopumilus sp.]
MNKILIFSLSILLVSFGNYAFAQSDDKLAVLETNLGTIVIEFFSNDAPKHVDNFIRLAESEFYDGVLFHRIIPGFMIQGGDPNTIDGDPSTWGTGGPSTSVDAEFNTIKHNRGIVSMARSADPNSGGSQFFIVHADSNFLDEAYTVFGRVVTDESFETLDKIAAVQTKSNDQPVDPLEVTITKVSIVNRSEVSNLLDLGEPERTESTIMPS